MTSGKRRAKWLFCAAVAAGLVYTAFFIITKRNLNGSKIVGERVDSLNGVIVFFNGGVGHVSGRNVSPDGYNIGLKFQCVEFVKRYYYQHYRHRMPDASGHAKDFFDRELSDGQLNRRRNLLQYANGSGSRPSAGDLLVFSGTIVNRYGHVAIISEVSDSAIEIIQQNPGPFSSSRETFSLLNEAGKWRIDNDRIAGWLRMRNKND